MSDALKKLADRVLKARPGLGDTLRDEVVAALDRCANVEKVAEEDRLNAAEAFIVAIRERDEARADRDTAMELSLTRADEAQAARAELAKMHEAFQQAVRDKHAGLDKAINHTRALAFEEAVRLLRDAVLAHGDAWSSPGGMLVLVKGKR